MQRSRTVDLGSVTWRKSSYSNNDGADCVELAEAVPGVIPVRDSKRTEAGAPVLLFGLAAWSAFMADISD
ncbi:DUF397 domain-containing protein [Streptomyces sp. NPDC001076]